MNNLPIIHMNVAVVSPLDEENYNNSTISLWSKQTPTTVESGLVPQLPPQ